MTQTFFFNFNFKKPPKNTLKIFVFFPVTSAYKLTQNPTSEHGLSKTFYSKFSSKKKNTLIFFPELFFQLPFFFPNTRNSTLTFFPFHTLKIFLRTLRFFFFSQNTQIFFSSLHRHLTFFFDFKKNLASVHPQTIEKFLSNIERN